MPRKKKRPKLNLPPHVCLKGPKREWHVRVLVPSPSGERDDQGRLRYVQITRKCDPPTAERAAAIVAFLEKEVAGEIVPRNVQTVHDFFRVFLDAKKPHVSRVTGNYYQDLYDRHIKPAALAGEQITEVQPIHIQMFFSKLVCPPATKKKIYDFIKMAFKQAVTWRVIIESPVTGVMLPKVRHKKTSALAEVEAKSVIKLARKDIKYLIVAVGLETGLRPEELIPLTWSDIDFEHQTISVNKAYIGKVKQGVHETSHPKTESSVRIVHISQELRDLLILQRGNIDLLKGQIELEIRRPLLKRMQWNLIVDGQRSVRNTGPNHERRMRHRRVITEQLKNLDALDLVFPSSKGSYLSIQNVNRRVVKELFRDAGLADRGLSFKSLRHTFASILAKYVGLPDLQAVLGHEDSRTTAKFYTHAEDDARKRASKKITEIYGDT